MTGVLAFRFFGGVYSHEGVANITACFESKVRLMFDPFGDTFGGDSWTHLEESIVLLQNWVPWIMIKLVRIHTCDFIAQNSQDVGRVGDQVRLRLKPIIMVESFG